NRVFPIFNHAAKAAWFDSQYRLQWTKVNRDWVTGICDAENSTDNRNYPPTTALSFINVLIYNSL
ncbi:MAG: hypothetical protein ACFE9C_17970, partial [Candidatus Hodarchaeota archaeon]